MNLKSLFNSKGLTIIELLLALVIFSMVVAGIYRVFVSQSRAYTVQDRVVDNQQSIRSAMEVLLKDLRMTGFDNDSLTSTISIVTPVVAGNSDITVNYEFDDTTQHSVRYWRDAQTLKRRLTVTTGGVSVSSEEDLLENVEELRFTYGVDEDDDKAIDDRHESGNLISPRVNPIDETDWLSASTVISRGLQDRVIAVRVRLSARPQPPVTEDQKMLSPRTLETTVTFRNLCMR